MCGEVFQNLSTFAQHQGTLAEIQSSAEIMQGKKCGGENLSLGIRIISWPYRK
jgi:hypothetical protein